MPKPWQESTGKRYHAYQDAVRKSARVENARRMEVSKPRIANPFKEDREGNPQAGPERILDLQALAAHVAKPLDPKVLPRLSNRLPPDAHPQNIFNIWDIEPRLLDELQHALESRDPEKIKQARMYIRAGSWSTHDRTDDQVAANEAKAMAARMIADQSARRSMLPDEGFERDTKSLESDIAGMEKVIEALESFSCDEKTEGALRCVENAIEEDWEKLLDVVKEEKLPWPKDSEEIQKLPGRAGDLGEKIVAWRKIRDQLSFQRLYTHLCKIGQEHSNTRAA